WWRASAIGGLRLGDGVSVGVLVVVCLVEVACVEVRCDAGSEGDDVGDLLVGVWRGMGWRWRRVGRVGRRPQVDLRVDTRSLQLVKLIVDPRKRITVLYSKLVQFTIVNTHSERSVFLLDKQDGVPRVKNSV
ncbi:hypothetical protein Tco_0584359, partial [Tanacetum coccineum]